MILKKVMKDNQIVYVEISKEEAANAENKDETVVYLDEETKSEEPVKNDEETTEKPEDEIDADDEEDDETPSFARGFARRIKHNIDRQMRRAGVHTHFHTSDDEDDDPKTRKLMMMLPFMDEEDIHEIIEKYLAGDADFSKLKLPAIMPFLNEQDCDAVFKKALTSKELNHYLMAVAPFVSQAALSKLIDQYLAGEYPDLDIDSLYPFLDPKDIKRAFHHWLKK